MTRIGVISDTHGSVSSWEKALQVWGDIDLIIHCGDVIYHGPSNALPEDYNTKSLPSLINSSQVPVLIAKGNCDSEVDQQVIKWPIMSPYIVVWWEGRLLMATHGTSFTKTREDSRKFAPDLVLTGHTHIASLTEEDGTLYLNPGSASLPKGRDPASVAILEPEGIIIRTLNGDMLYHQKWHSPGRFSD